MEKSFLLRKLVFAFVLIFLTFPLLYLLSFIDGRWVDFDPFLFVVLEGALVQALLSTTITLFVGFVGALGLIGLRQKLNVTSYQTLSLLAVLPSFLPPIIIIVLGGYGLRSLPTGLSGVVFFHSLMNIGLVSVMLSRVISVKAPRWLRGSLLANVPMSKFILRGLLPELKFELLRLSFYFMILYFFSFSVPLMVGGLSYGGLEVFIYEKILLFGKWSEALQYSLLLFILLFLCSYFVADKQSKPEVSSSGDRALLRFFTTSPLSSVALAPTVFLALSLVFALVTSVGKLDINSWWLPMRGSLIIGMSTGLSVFILLSLLSFSFLSQRLSRYFLSLVSPGWVVVGFAFLLMPGDQPGLSLLKVGIALSILYLPYLFRLQFFQTLKDLRGQVELAQVFPVSWWKVFSQVIWPQCLPAICFLSGLAGLWACGDFALTGIVVSGSNTSSLALDMKNLISSYRLEQSLLLLLPLLFSTFIVFFLFQGLSYVGRRKISS